MFYVLLFWTSLKEGERAREKARGDINCLSWIPSKQQQQRNKKEKLRRNKTGTSGCGSFVVAYFQPATSTDCLHVHAWVHVSMHASLCVHRYILTIIHSCLSLPVQNLHESVSILMKARVTMKMTMMGVREINIRQFKETLKQI